MHQPLIFILAFFIGVLSGLRSLAPITVVVWGAFFGWINFHQTFLEFLYSTTSLVIFSMLAALELIGDKLPQTPNRTGLLGLTARFFLGGLSGMALMVAADRSPVIGALLGGIGGAIGAFVGYQLRTKVVKASRAPDFVIAILEDIIAIGGTILIVYCI